MIKSESNPCNPRQKKILILSYACCLLESNTQRLRQDRSRFWGGQSEFTQVTPRVFLWPILYISPPWLGQERKEWQLSPSGTSLRVGIRGVSMLSRVGYDQHPLVHIICIWVLSLWTAYRVSHVKVATCKCILVVSKRISNSVETGGRCIEAG